MKVNLKLTYNSYVWRLRIHKGELHFKVLLLPFERQMILFTYLTATQIDCLSPRQQSKPGWDSFRTNCFYFDFWLKCLTATWASWDNDSTASLRIRRLLIYDTWPTLPYMIDTQTELELALRACAHSGFHNNRNIISNINIIYWSSI